MMKETPILFSTTMVQAILAGTKTMTRRVIKPQPVVDEDSGYTYVGHHSKQLDIHNWKEQLLTMDCRFGIPTDMMWVKETHYRYGSWHNQWNEKKGKSILSFIPDPQFREIRYFDNPPAVIEKKRKTTAGWYKRPSIHMPKRCCRIWLEIVSIEIEQLHDITEKDAKAEGVKTNSINGTDEANGEWWNYTAVDYDDFPCFSAKESFESLWQSINGKESWDENPWVWVIKFKHIKPFML